eukprot:1143039-Pyramimonas_sp.AAC.1
MLERTLTGHPVIQCPKYGEATPGSEGESEAGAPIYVSPARDRGRPRASISGSGHWRAHPRDVESLRGSGRGWR